MRVLVGLLLAIVASAAVPLSISRLRRSQKLSRILEMSSPGADWGNRGREAAVANLILDGKPHQQVMLFAGAKRHTYRVSLGRSPGGPSRDPYSSGMRGSRRQGPAWKRTHVEDRRNLPQQLGLRCVRLCAGAFREVEYCRAVFRHPAAAVLRALRVDGEDTLQYTVIFSNEDGGTSTRALMGRWGRTTDIEYVYQTIHEVRNSHRAGTRITSTWSSRAVMTAIIRLLMPVTDNNMIAEAKDSPLQFRLAADRRRSFPVVTGTDHGS